MNGEQSITQAMRSAGYSEATANAAQKVVLRRKGVREALMRIAQSMSNRDISDMSKGKLIQILEDPEIEPRTVIQAIRMGLELGGEVGMNKELIMRHEIHVPAAAQEMIARMIIERQEKNNNADTRRALPLENVPVGEKS